MPDLRKLSLIFRREYLTRLRSKTFIISTILVPLAFILIVSIPIGIQLLSSGSHKTIAIVDQTGTIYPRLKKMNADRYKDFSDFSDQKLRNMVMQEKIDGYIRFTVDMITGKTTPELIYSGGGGLSFLNNVKADIREAVRDERIERAKISPEIRNIFEENINLTTRKITKEGKEEETNAVFYSAFGTIMAFIIYIAMFSYGAIIMRGVMEEKTNRIIEVITSSVKPFELLIGKVLGVGALGLSQFLIWIGATIGLLAGISPIATMILGPKMLQNMAGSQAAAQQTPALQVPSVDPIIWVYLVVYFLLGYLIYSSLFAAVGAAVDSESETQQLVFPITIPIIISIMLMPQVANAPDSTLAVVSSLIPLFSPILMVARIPITDVPFWQIGLSFLLMAGTFVGLMALSAKIYRVGILMYGKKASFKEMIKWVRYR